MFAPACSDLFMSSRCVECLSFEKADIDLDQLGSISGHRRTVTWSSRAPKEPATSPAARAAERAVVHQPGSLHDGGLMRRGNSLSSGSFSPHLGRLRGG